MVAERVPSHLKEKYPNGWCPHSIKICLKCGKFRGYGSHGKLTVIPDGCKKQVETMRKAPTSKAATVGCPTSKAATVGCPTSKAATVGCPTSKAKENESV
jgi:hypothetical protein